MLCGCGGGGSASVANPPVVSTGTGTTQPPTPQATPSLTVSLSIAPQTVVAGQLATLTWTAANAVSISFSPALPAAEDRQLTLPTGSATFPVAQTTTYIATVTDAAGNHSTANATVTVLPVQFTFSAEPDTIHPGESATLTWASEGIASLSIDGGVGDVSALLPNGSVTVSPAATTTYTATATDRSGAILVERVVVSVASPPPPQHPIRHIVFMLQENRTFDNYFAALGAYRASKLAGASPRDVDGVDPSTTLQTKTGKSVRPYHYQTVCTEGFTFAWNESHAYMDLQSPATFMDNDFTNAKFLMDKFAKNVNLTTMDPDGTRQMGYYNASDLPYYNYYAAEKAEPKTHIYVESGFASPQIREISEVSNVVRGLQQPYELHRICFPAEVKTEVYALYHRGDSKTQTVH